MKKYIHIRIPELLEKHSVSKTRLCKDLDLQHGNLNKYCRDDFKRIDAALIIKLCDYFKCDISDLLEIREVPEEPKSSRIVYEPIRRKRPDL